MKRTFLKWAVMSFAAIVAVTLGSCSDDNDNVPDDEDDEIEEVGYQQPTEDIVKTQYTGTKDDAYFFLGGIVGGLRYSSNVSGEEVKKPHATITDCSSWWRAWPDTQASTGVLQQGSLIGRARYSVQQGSTNDENGMYDCEGNWWIGTVGAGSWKTGNEALAIGKKNSVTPTEPTPPNQ